MSALWSADFVMSQGSVRVRETGHQVRLDAGLWRDVRTWLRFYLAVEALRLSTLFSRRTGAIAFLPRRARPWYLIWAVAVVARLRVVDDPAKADIVMQFHDATLTVVASQTGSPARAINFDCRDISKTTVARAFERAAGYGLEVDPAHHQGPMVEKGETNGAHDGRVVTGPVLRRVGKAYQRLIDNRVDNAMVEDLRTVTVGGEPVLVFRKRRAVGRRFANENADVSVAAPSEVYSPAELDLIRRFTRELRLDWGGVDVLRDRTSGRIYIVDANKTDMGPPLALPLREKLRAVRIIADAFVRAFGKPAIMRRRHRAYSDTAFQLGLETRKGALPAPERGPVQIAGGPSC